MIRNRAGLPDRVTSDQGQAREWYRKERQLELFGEGDRWYMMRNWMIAGDLVEDVHQMMISHSQDGRTKCKSATPTTVDKRAWKDNAYRLQLQQGEEKKDLHINKNPGV